MVRQITTEDISVLLTQLPFVSYCCRVLPLAEGASGATPDDTTKENLVIQNLGCSGNQIAPAVLETTPANGFVAAGVEKCWPPLDQHEMHDIFIVISEGRDGKHIARTFYAADLDDARRTHQEIYADEPLVAVCQ